MKFLLFTWSTGMGALFSCIATALPIQQQADQLKEGPVAVSWPAPWGAEAFYTTAWNVYSADIPYGVLSVSRESKADRLVSVMCDRNYNCPSSPQYSQSYPNYDPQKPALTTLIGFYGAGRDKGQILVLATTHIEGNDVPPSFRLYYTIAPASQFVTSPPSLEKGQWYPLAPLYGFFEYTQYYFCTYADSRGTKGRIHLYMSYTNYYANCTAGGTPLPDIDFQVKE